MPIASGVLLFLRSLRARSEKRSVGKCWKRLLFCPKFHEGTSNWNFRKMETMLPMTAEAIKITEKKMNMSLDDIIKMSKKSSSKAMKSRPLRRGQVSLNSGTSQGKLSKVQQFLDSRSSIRQELLSWRRLNSKGYGQPPVAEFARSAAIAPICDRVFTYNKNKYWKRPRPAYGPFQMTAIEGGAARKAKKASELRPGQTLDSLFANMKAQRMRMFSQRQMQDAQPLRATQGPQQRGRGVRRAEAAPFASQVEACYLHHRNEHS